jgi:peroxiredoxin
MKLISAILLSLTLAAITFGQNEQAPITEKEFAYKDWTHKSINGGDMVNLRDSTKGKKLVMVVYWAPWCPNWVHDVAFVQGLHEKYKDKGLAIIGVGEYDPVSKMRSHIDKYKLTFPMVYESEKLSDRLTSVHYSQRTEAGDKRKWGSPWYVFLDPATLEPNGELLTKKTTVVNGELIKQDAEKYIQQKLGVSGSVVSSDLNTKGEIEVCEPEQKIAKLKRP